MKIVGVCNQKGGVGKTTTVMHLGAALSRMNTVLVVDVDPQSSATRWARRGEEDLPFDFVSEMDPTNIATLRDIEGYDIVLVDTPGSHENTGVLSAVLQVVDFLVLPTSPSFIAIEALTDTIAEHVVPADVDYRLLLNMVSPIRGMRRLHRLQNQLDSVEFIDGLVGLPRFRNFIRLSASIEDSAGEGRVVTQFPDTKEYRAPIADYTSVAHELMTMLTPKEA